MATPTPTTYLSTVNQSPYLQLRSISDKGYLGGAKNMLINMTKVIGKLVGYIFASLADFSIGLRNSVKNIFVNKKIAQIQEHRIAAAITPQTTNENTAPAPATNPAPVASTPAPALPKSEPALIEQVSNEDNASALAVINEEKDGDDLSSVASINSKEEKYPTSNSSARSSLDKDIPEIPSTPKNFKTKKAALSPAPAPEKKSSCAARVANKVSNTFNSIKSGTYQAGCSLGNGIVYAGSSVKSGMYKTGSFVGNGFVYTGSSIKSGVYNAASSVRNLFNLTSN